MGGAFLPIRCSLLNLQIKTGTSSAKVTAGLQDECPLFPLPQCVLPTPTWYMIMNICYARDPCQGASSTLRCAYMCARCAVSHMDAKLHFNSIGAAALFPLPRRVDALSIHRLPSNMCFAEPLRPRSVTRSGARLYTTVGEPQMAQIPVNIGT